MTAAEPVVGEPQVSVVIPAWGDPYLRTLPEAIASARSPVTRVIVVLVPSEEVPDLPPGVVEVRGTGPMSVGAARNLGLAAVETPYVVFLDADDVLQAGALQRMLATLNAMPEAVAVVGQVRTRDSGEIVAPRRAVAIVARWPALLAFTNAIWSLLPTQGSTMMRTAAVRSAGGYADDDGGEDWALGVGLALSGPIAVLAVSCLLYLPSAGRLYVPPMEMTRRSRLARERWRQQASGGARAALPFIALAQLVLVRLVRPLVRLVRRSGE